MHGELASDMPPADATQLIALFRARNRDGWRVSLTILTALANFLPVLPEEESYLVLFHDARRVAAEFKGQAPRQERAALASRPVFPPLSAGCGIGRPYAIVRRPSARCSRSLRAGPRRPNALTSCLQTATDRAFADTGHSLDFINKAFECLDLIGWKHAAAVCQP
jgi:hypothetical protein